jgi:hypothetical protein
VTDLSAGRTIPGHALSAILTAALVLLAPSARGDGPCRPAPGALTIHGKTPTEVRAARPPAGHSVRSDEPDPRAGGAEPPQCFDAKALETKVAAVMDSPGAQAVLCYQKALLRDRDAKGTATVHFQLRGGSGAPRMEAVKLVSGTIAAEVAECLVEQVARTVFNFDPRTHLTVFWTFRFSPLN